MKKYSVFLKSLLKWHDLNHRPMPWHLEKDPYKIWISEIILQQTRVEQGTKYYLRFIERFPNVGSLAKAKEDEVLKLWEGLGYYSRARNLHKAARLIIEEFKGDFPNNYDELIRLPGIGPYTAAAISSFAYGEEKAVIDGNVLRVISRVYGIGDPIDAKEGKNKIAKIVNALVQKADPAIYNQAIMNFGALMCKPKNPDCNSCLCKNDCIAHLENQVQKLPIKSKKIKQRKRYFHFFHIFNEEELLIEKRSTKDIWKSLYQFPLIENESEALLNFETINPILSPLCKQFIVFKGSEVYTHKLTHQTLKVRFYKVLANQLMVPKNSSLHLIKKESMSNFAFPRLINLYLDKKPIPLFKS